MIQHRFEFKNMIAGTNLEQYANTNLAALMRSAPYSATSEAILEKNPVEFKATIKVGWGVKHLAVQAMDVDVQRCLQRAFANLRGEISRWRRDRILKAKIQAAGPLGPILKRRKTPG